MSAILQTLIGAAAAIVGGFVGAWWQTRRADDIARRIRREERREQALLALDGKAGDVYNRLRNIRLAAETAPLTGQYEAARQVIEELFHLWVTDWFAVIPDQAVTDTYQEFYVRASELLPGGAQAMVQYTEDEPRAKAEHFRNDLHELIALVARLSGKARGAIAVQ